MHVNKLSQALQADINKSKYSSLFLAKPQIEHLFLSELGLRATNLSIGKACTKVDSGLTCNYGEEQIL